jgi:hypothetical protein
VARTVIERVATAIAGRWAEITDATFDMLKAFGRACPGDVDEDRAVFFARARVPNDLPELPDKVAALARGFL